MFYLIRRSYSSAIPKYFRLNPYKYINPGMEKRKGQDRKTRRENESPEVKLSKSLSWALRHGAQSAGLAIRSDGYVRVTDILAHNRFKGATLEAIENVVKENDKQRFSLISEADPKYPTRPHVWWIRANQGHSIKAVEIAMVKITDPSSVPMAVHGTTLDNWKHIATQGLSRMQRNHIHLAQGLPGADGVISGMRTTSQILIFVDIAKAIAAGYEFLLSANGVVLTPGNNQGILPTEYFARVESARTRTPVTNWDGSIIPQNANASGPADDDPETQGAWTAITQKSASS